MKENTASFEEIGHNSTQSSIPGIIRRLNTSNGNKTSMKMTYVKCVIREGFQIKRADTFYVS